MAYTIIETCNGCGACARICPTQAITGRKKQVHEIDRELCIDCGACGRVCPNSAVRDQFGGECTMIRRSQWGKPVFNIKLCMSCSMCIDACPTNCLELAGAGGPKDPHGYPRLIREKACIGCGICAAECPVGAISMAVPAAAEEKSPGENEKKAAAG